MKNEASDKSYLPSVIFSYSIEHLLQKDKVRFYYALKGRDGKTGIVKRYKIEQLGRAVLFVPDKQAAEVEQFLQYWKCKYQKEEVLAQ